MSPSLSLSLPLFSCHDSNHIHCEYSSKNVAIAVLLIEADRSSAIRTIQIVNNSNRATGLVVKYWGAKRTHFTHIYSICTSCFFPKGARNGCTLCAVRHIFNGMGTIILLSTLVAHNPKSIEFIIRQNIGGKDGRLCALARMKET